ncbi:MAG: hypothetical protein KUG77_12105, partial [Nannocystaceae bacterium]|nr:hypothetical protein [Nannocystaceae bacterium]
MEALFKKYFWVVQGIGLAVITGLAASAIVTQLGTMFALDTSAYGSDEDGDTDGESEDEDAPPKKRRPSSSSSFNQASTLAS